MISEGYIKNAYRELFFRRLVIYQKLIDVMLLRALSA
jgi:hypothetical protein